MDGGLTVQHVNAPATTTVFLHNTGVVNDLQQIETEMTQLDISGGDLPVGVRVRESPTLHSTGRTTIEVREGGYNIESYFDVNVELSLDGGQTWEPSSLPAFRMKISDNNPIPTVSEWGLIILGLLTLTVGTIFIMRQRKSMPTAVGVV